MADDTVPVSTGDRNKKLKRLKISHHHLFTVKPVAPFRGAQKEREGMVYLGIYHRCEGRQKNPS